MRKLSLFQKRDWMIHIRKKRKTNPDYRGSKHPRSRLSDKQVEVIRRKRFNAKDTAYLYGITERYVYQLWSGERRK